MLLKVRKLWTTDTLSNLNFYSYNKRNNTCLSRHGITPCSCGNLHSKLNRLLPVVSAFELPRSFDFFVYIYNKLYL